MLITDHVATASSASDSTLSTYSALYKLLRTNECKRSPYTRFIPSASPFLSRCTSSSTYQLISVMIHTLVIHHSFTLSLQAQKLPFQQILATVDFFYLLDCLTITELDRTYHAHHFIFSFTFYFFCLFRVVD